MNTDAPKAPIVLVHGGRHGGWCWERLIPYLSAQGHPVRWPTLTGLGERAHLLKRLTVDLQTHVDDIVGVIEHNRLEDVLLVGHSYAGMVIAGVAARIPERIRHLVYLDALVPESGEAHLDVCDPERAEDLRRLIADHGGDRVPAGGSGLAYFGITAPEDEAWVGARLTDQPAATYQQPLGDLGPAAGIPRTFVRCTWSDLVSRTSLSRVEADPRFDLVELDAGHDVMVTAPELLAPVLTRLAG